MMLILPLLGILICLCLQAFFSISEMSTISSDRIRISHLSYTGDKRAKQIEGFLKEPEKFLAVTLVGTNLAVVTASAIAGGVASRYFGNPYLAAGVSTLVLLPIILVFGEITPKTIARKHSTVLALSIALSLRRAYNVLFPLVILATRAADFFSELAGSGKPQRNPFVTREELKLLIRESFKRGIFDEQVSHMANEIFDFGETTVRAIMVPIKNVVSIPDTSTIRDAAAEIARTGYSRIPVYHNEDSSAFMGFVQSWDIICERHEAPVNTLVRQPYIVKDDQIIEDVLDEMRRNREQFAMVEDKSGSVVGVVTLEDIIEEIIGEIEDEYTPKKGPA